MLEGLADFATHVTVRAAMRVPMHTGSPSTFVVVYVEDFEIYCQRRKYFYGKCGTPEPASTVCVEQHDSIPIDEVYPRGFYFYISSRYSY